jgi:hypothetical protein
MSEAEANGIEIEEAGGFGAAADVRSKTRGGEPRCRGEAAGADKGELGGVFEPDLLVEPAIGGGIDQQQVVAKGMRTGGRGRRAGGQEEQENDLQGEDAD